MTRLIAALLVVVPTVTFAGPEGLPCETNAEWAARYDALDNYDWTADEARAWLRDRGCPPVRIVNGNRYLPNTQCEPVCVASTPVAQSVSSSSLSDSIARATARASASTDTSDGVVWTVAQTAGNSTTVTFVARDSNGTQLRGTVSWTVTDGASIVSGQGTSSIVVNHNGNVTATASTLGETRAATYIKPGNAIWKSHWLWIGGAAAGAYFFPRVIWND